MVEIKTGLQSRPSKVLIYTVEGLGKSTLLAELPRLGHRPLFLDTDDGLVHIPEAESIRVNNKKEWDESIAFLLGSAHPYDTAVVDTVTSLEPMVESLVMTNYKKNSMGDFDYGQGYLHLRGEFDKILMLQLDPLIRRGMHVVVLAHAATQRVQLPELTESFERYTLAIDKGVSALLRQWSDHVLFGNWDYRFTKNSQQETRGIAGTSRQLFTQHTAAWDAKNRARLPEKLEWKIEALRPLFLAAAIQTEEQTRLWMEFAGALEKRGVTSPDLLRFLQRRFPVMKSLEDWKFVPANYLAEALKQPENFKQALDEFINPPAQTQSVPAEQS